MKIYIDFWLPEEALACLREGTLGHELVFSGKPSGTVLGSGGLDADFAEAEIALGQPDPEGVAASERLR